MTNSTSWLTTPPPRADRGIGGTGERTDDLTEAAGIIAGILMGTACWGVVALFWWIAT